MGREPDSDDGELSHRYAVEGISREMLKYIPKRKFSSIDSQIITRTLYDELWGIHSHEKDENPLSQVLVYPNETAYGKNNLIESRLKIYLESRVLDYTGLSFAEYLELPRNQQRIITEVCIEERKKRDKKSSDLQNELENLEKKLK